MKILARIAIRNASPVKETLNWLELYFQETVFPETSG